MLVRDEKYYAVASCMAIVAMLTIIFCVIAIHQLVKKLRRNSSHSIKPDQILLIGLCASDILLGTTGILHSAFMFLARRPPTKLLYAANYIYRFNVLSSLLHVLALTIERVMFVKFPFLHRSCRSRSPFIIGTIIWVLSICLSIMPFTKLMMVLSPIIITCDVILIVAYVYILKKICQSIKTQASTRRVAQDKNVDREVSQKGGKATLVCILVVASFIACTTPPLVWIIQHQHQFVGRFYIQQNIEDYIMITVLISKGAFDPLVYIFRKGIARRLCWKKLLGIRRRSNVDAL